MCHVAGSNIIITVIANGCVLEMLNCVGTIPIRSREMMNIVMNSKKFGKALVGGVMR